VLREYGSHLSQTVKDKQYLTAKAKIHDKAMAVGFVVDRTDNLAAYVEGTRRCKPSRCQCLFQFSLQ
jgi:hypothetical protein